MQRVKSESEYRKKESYGKRLLKDIQQKKMIYILVVPILAYYLIFHYGAMYGALIAFQDFKPAFGFSGSEWVGFEHFLDFFNSPNFTRVFKNTLLLSFYNLIFAFPAPIIFAILLNEVRNKFFKKTIQTLSYLPHFISMVILCSLILNFTSSTGIITQFFEFFGVDAGSGGLIANPDYYRSIYVVSGIWQTVGWGSIVYLAAISSIDTALYESAYIDGANKFRMIWNITIPSIMPTIITMLILNVGNMLNIGWEKVFLTYSPLTYETADIISTFVYRKGITELNYSFATAVGLFNSVINCALLITANRISRRLTQTSLW